MNDDFDHPDFDKCKLNIRCLIIVILTLVISWAVVIGIGYGIFKLVKPLITSIGG